MKLRTYSFSFIFFIFLSNISLVPLAAAVDKIMPLGDSITEGISSGVVPALSDYYVSYRKALWDKLLAAGYDIDFVGSLNSGSAIFGASEPADHEGHPGWTDDEILNGRPGEPGAGKLADWLVAYQPDIVLLHIGTNGVDPSPADVEAILDEIDDFDLNTWVVLALIINRACSEDTVPCPESQKTMDFNDNVEDMALDRKNDPSNPAYPDKIIIVDMEAGADINYNIQPAGDMWDNLHPFETDGYAKMADLWFTGLMKILPRAAEIIGTFDNGISYWDVAQSKWTQMTADSTTGDIAAGDFTGDGKADVASIWERALWYQNGDTLAWTKIPGNPPHRVTAGDVTGDGRAEIIGTWPSGIWYWDVALSKWTQMTADATTGDIAAGDFTGDGKADVASVWDRALWYQDGDTLAWTKIPGNPPHRVTAGDVTGDGRAEIIGTWPSGIWYWDVALSKWTQMTADATTGDIAAGDFTADGKADVASVWGGGIWYQDGDTLAWTKVPGNPPVSLTAGDVTGQ